MVSFIRSDLDFILQQIRIAEQNAAGTPMQELLPNAEVPFGLRTLTGINNNLVPGQVQFGAADNMFPRLTDPYDRPTVTFSFNPSVPSTPTTYGSTTGSVMDTAPRVISNLIVDQTTNNPAAVAAAAGSTNNSFDPVLGSIVTSPGLDGLFGTPDDITNVEYIPNVKSDFNLTVPFNSWMTFFGQFFDHGLDLVQKSATEVVLIPLLPDDPLYRPGSHTNFMVLSRAVPGALNTTSPFVDQNQTYTSHPSHQAFLREYVLIDGKPVDTGRLLTRHDLGTDGKFGTTDDTDLGGMATWATVKAQAHDILGINLTDANVGNVPLLLTDDYGNFVRGAHGFPMVVMQDGTVVEGDPTANGGLGININSAVSTQHQFLNDIAHAADPAPGLTRHVDGSATDGPPPAGTYDGDLLDAHYIAGDGRVNENIGLTAVHDIFHSEHNRLVQHTKDVLLADAAAQLAGGATQAAAVTFLNQWLTIDVNHVPVGGEIASLQWDGDRLFQAAKFGTEMQYQHLVFEEFARTIQPNIDEFLAPFGYDVTINPSIVAEFAHTVYRFGHSMLTETVDRLDPNFNPVTIDPLHPSNDQQLGLIAAFLNPLAYAASGLTNEQATGAIVRGVTRQVGNDIDEFVTDALRNNLVGLPLDLAVLNIARGRDTLIPSLNEARREFYEKTGDGQLRPYSSWADFLEELKHPESLINFIAAYGTHSSITSQATLAGKRAAATVIVLGGSATFDPDNNPSTNNSVTLTEPSDRLDFLNSTGAWANTPGPDGLSGTADDVTITGLDDVDFWVGGLAERQMPNGGLLGSTFNFVFETQLENLQNADRFYYLSRTASMHFGTELENNTFARLVMLNSDATHLPADIFQTPKFILEADQSHQFNAGLGAADPTGGIAINGNQIIPVVERDNSLTPANETGHYLHYNGAETVVIGGTAGDDDLMAGSSDDDTIYGDAGRDRLDGGFGNDNIFGGDGDDLITDLGGNDVIHGDAGNDVIFDGHSLITPPATNILLGGDGKDFIATADDISIIFGGTGDDFILGNKVNLPETGNEGDDWIETGTQDGAPGDNFNPLLLDDVPGNDIFIGGGGFDEMIGEGGDDIFTGSDAQDKMDGMSGFDWVTYKFDRQGVTVDLTLAALNEPPVAPSPASVLDRFAEVDGLSGSKFADDLKGEETVAATRAGITAKSQALAGSGIALISGMQSELDALFAAELTPGGPALQLGVAAAGGHITSFDSGNFILGGSGSDLITARGGDDLIDGDKWLNVRISVRAGFDPVTGAPVGPEIASFDSMKDLVPFMLNRTYNPGQLFAVRELKDDATANRDAGSNFDTANYRGPLAEYTFAVNGGAATVAGGALFKIVNGVQTALVDGDVVTVSDTSVKPRDGVDHLIHVERLQFGDQAVVLRQGLNAAPNGAATVSVVGGGGLRTGSVVQASIAGVTDADGIPADGVRYTWQSEKVPGSNVFEDIVLLPAGDLAFESASGKFFQLSPLVDGLRLRLKVTYQDGHGVTEQVFSAPTDAVTAVAGPPPAPPVIVPDATAGGPGINLVRSDLDFILKQIKIAEAHAAGVPLTDLIPNVRLAYGLRAVDGSENNLLVDKSQHINQTEFGAADNTFPRLLTPEFKAAEGRPANTFGLGDPGTASSSYLQTKGGVYDSQPRTISNLVVDQTVNNPSAYAAAMNPGADGVLNYSVPIGQPGNDDVLKENASIVASPGLDGVFGTTDDKQVFKIENIKPDFGLTAPYNSWFTFFGQFFDHGLDLVTKGGSGTVFVPLKPDDPLYNPDLDGADNVVGVNPATGINDDPNNFMVLSRATNMPGPDGILGTSDDIHEQENTTTPFVDQNQTYTSHPSHQVFLREYALDANGHPVATGKLITNHALDASGNLTIGADGHLQGDLGGMATWAVVKAQAREMLGIDLTDANVFNAPLLETDQYGNFKPDPVTGFPKVVVRLSNGADGKAGTADDVLTTVSGTPGNPVNLLNPIAGNPAAVVVGTGHQFLIDIAHAADPSSAPGLARHTDGSATDGPTPAGTYDGDLLDKHYIAGDGRVNENIGLTAVHNIFHHEHNRLIDQAKGTVLAQHDLSFLNQWLLPTGQLGALPTTQAQIDALQWNGERLFQTAKFGTEMQYQHLVFEEFARAVQPMVDPFFAPTQVYDVDLDPSIVAEFAHTVYRFGHSMLTETVDRFDANFNIISADPLHPAQDASGHQIGLIAAFLNPLAFEASGVSAEAATGAIVRGVTRDVGNELDEFVTEALRNNLVGLPLDLATLNLARGRDTGIPSLNTARRDFFTQTGDSWVKPYESWAEFVKYLKHPESLINFIAAYGKHSAITGATTLAEKRDAAALLVLGDGNDADGVVINGVTYTDRLDFLNSTGAWANVAITLPGKDKTLGTADDIPSTKTITGVDDIDFWIGGLAEVQTVFGGLLGSTFNFVFENQLEKLQDGDRFYYLERTDGLSFRAELESNSFAKLIMANTTATHLPGLVFLTPAFTLEADPTKQFTGLGADGRADPTGGIGINGQEVVPLVIRTDPNPDPNPSHAHYDTYLEYTPHGLDAQTVVLGGTSGNDKLIAGDSDDDTIWGDAGNDYINGGYGNDHLRGGDGDDIIVDTGGDDNIQGGDGDDVIQGGNGANLILGGFGSDWIITGEDASEAFGGQGNDFILGSKANEQDIGNEGDDWIEKGTSDGAPGDNFDPLGLDPIVGNDVFIGDGENDKFIGEGGDDIMIGKTGMTDRYFGGSGFDWVDFKFDTIGVTIDISKFRFYDSPPVPGGVQPLVRFDIDEGVSGSHHADMLTGDELLTYVNAGAKGSVLTQIGLIDGLQGLLDTAFGTEIAAAGGAAAEVSTHVFADAAGHITSFDGGNILLGADGSDFLTGLGGNDVIDGDRWLNVRISVRDTVDNDHNGVADRDANGVLLQGAEIYTADTMTDTTLQTNMLNGTWSPGQLKIVREILTSPTADFDTAVFRGNAADYQIDFNPLTNVVTVTDSVAARDGTDHLIHIERLMFADLSLNLVDGANFDPVGFAQVSDTTPKVGDVLTVTLGGPFGVTDGNNVTPTNLAGQVADEPVAYFWQQDLGGNGVFTDITSFAAGEVSRLEGRSITITPNLAGVALRVRAVYKDAAGNLEQVTSLPTAAVEVNVAPVITSLGGGATAATAIDENLTTVTTVTASDPNAGDVPVFSIAGGADAGKFSINAVSGVLSFVTPPDFEARGSAANSNVYDVIVRASDGSLSTTQQIAVTVNNVNDIAPVITTSALLSIPENSTAVTTITATDADLPLPAAGQSPFTFALAGGADAGKFAINSTTGALSFITAPDFEAPADAGANNVYDVNVSVSDGIFTTTKAIAVTVTDVPGITVVSNAATITGTEEADSLTGGNAPNTIIGLGGNDVLNGAGANDTLNGGAGNDTLNGGAGNGDIAVFASPVSQALFGLNPDASITVTTPLDGTDTLTAIEILRFAGSDFNLRQGSDAGETINGNATNELILGFGGVDTLNGGGGGDAIFGGAGGDTMSGGAGADLLFGGDGADVLSGDGGADSLFGDAGNDIFNYVIGDGTDSFDGGADSDTLNITAGNANDRLDVIFDGTRIIEVQGGAVTSIESITAALGGNAGAGDTLSYDPAGAGVTTAGVTVNLGAGTASGFTSVSQIENVIGGDGNDTLTGDNGANTLTGGAGNDTLEGGLGADTLSGNAGDDTFVGFAGADTVNGGANTDTIVLNATSTDLNAAANAQISAIEQITALGALTGVTINLSAQTEGFLITGSALADTLTGGSGGDTFIGFAGADTVNGNAGNDTITLTATSTSLNAASDAQISGIELVSAATAGAGVTISLAGQTEAIAISGGAGGDTLIGGSGANAIDGGAGDDTLSGGLGDDTLTGGAGTDTATFVNPASEQAFTLNANGTITITGQPVTPQSTPLEGTDTLSSIEILRFGGIDLALVTGTNAAGTTTGTAANELILGFDGNDTLNGGDGNDVIYGGNGNDTVNGGNGDDIIVYTAVGAANANAAGGREIVDGGADGSAAGDRFVLNGSAAAENFRIYTRADWIAEAGNAGARAARAAQLNGATEIVVTRTVIGNNTPNNNAVVAELRGIEEITINTGAGNDVVFTSGNFNASSLHQNTITISDGGGDDTVNIASLSSSHRVVFHSGAGSDTFVGPTRPQDVIDLGSSSGIKFVGTSSGNMMGGQTGAHVLTGLGGNDVYMVDGDDTIVETADGGLDTVVSSTVDIDLGHYRYVERAQLCGNLALSATGTDAADVLNGEANSSANVLRGLKGNDFYVVGSGDTVVETGNGGNDTVASATINLSLASYANVENAWLMGNRDLGITGGVGDNILRGNTGNNVMSGGGGNDIFRFAAGFGNDRITDFDPNAAGGQDKLDISAFGITAANFAQHVQIVSTGHDTIVVIDGDGNQKVRLENVDRHAMNAEDFILFAG